MTERCPAMHGTAQDGPSRSIAFSTPTRSHDGQLRTVTEVSFQVPCQ